MPRTPYPATTKRARIEARHARLQRLGYRDYAAYLRSGAWFDLRRRYFASDQPQDCICGERENLQLHHLTYERVGEELLSDLTPLCSTCHAMIHALEARGDMTLDPASLADAERAFLYGLEQRKRAASIFDPITAAIDAERLGDRTEQTMKWFTRTILDRYRPLAREGRDLSDLYRWFDDVLVALRTQAPPDSVRPPRIP